VTQYRKKRHDMVVDFLLGRNIRDERILAAFEDVPRHHYVDEALWAKSYGDHHLPIGHQQTISQPYIVARMVELLSLDPTARVLEIGTGSGYQTAILAKLSAQVFSIERIPELARRAQTTLENEGIRNVTVKVFDGTYGWAEMAPFDGIVVSAGAPAIPEPLKSQLSLDGRMVIPVGGEMAQALNLVTRTGAEQFEVRKFEDCVFVPLLGHHGWK